MRARSIFCIAILFAVVFQECLSLRGGEDAVCWEIPYPPGLNDDSDFVPHDSFSGDYADDDNDEERSTREPMAWHGTMIKMEKCCEGYLNNGGTCEPQCESGCENGHCSKPGKCACDVGYEETPLNTCIPKCNEHCINGNCTGPNECTCNEGYRLSADRFTCEPVCSSTCENGWCSKPEICDCHPGYKRNGANECEPICTLECENGKCVKPDTCDCDAGFESPQGNKSLCVPTCLYACFFQHCTLPDNCTCKDGYFETFRRTHMCRSKCKSPCSHGWCSAPEVCQCDPGYKRSDNNECLPVCDKPCKNGTCVAPDTCVCSHGFEKSKDDASVCQPRCSRPCSSGKCTAPETCTCDIGHRLGKDKYTCGPVCDMACENGYCAEPNVCGCHRGYQKNATNGCDPVCQISCTNGKCVGPDRCECDVGFQPMKENVFACEPICSQPCGSGTICTAPETCTCNEGEARNGSCADSRCKTSCNQGVCTSKGCACLLGWVGESCDEPLFCTVTQPANVNVVNEQNPFAKPTMIKIEDENYQFKWKGPTCHKRCLDQLNTTAVNLTRTNGITTQYFVPVDSPCNVIEKSPELSMWSSTVMWTVIGIASIAVIVFIGVIFVRIRQRARIGEYTQRLVNDLVEVEQIVHL